MPAEILGEDYVFLRPDQMLSFEEIARVARIAAELGVNKVKITGGEPLLRDWLADLIEQLSGIPEIEDIALITNGHYLGRMARRLEEAGLNRVTVSLDSLNPERYAEMSGRGRSIRPVLNAISTAQSAGLDPVKINTVVIRGTNDEEVVELVRHFRNTGVIVRFIEYMDVGNRNDWSRSKVVPSAELRDRIGREFEIEPIDPNYFGEVADRYRLADGSGEIGFISSVTQPFCRGCTRARLSAEGRLYTCLFASEGTDLRIPLRNGSTDTELGETIRGVWRTRDDRYSELRAERADSAEVDSENNAADFASDGDSGAKKTGNQNRRIGDLRKKVEMYHIGG